MKRIRANLRYLLNYLRQNNLTTISRREFEPSVAICVHYLTCMDSIKKYFKFWAIPCKSDCFWKRITCIYRKIRIRLTFFITWAKIRHFACKIAMTILIFFKLIPDQSCAIMFYVTVRPGYSSNQLKRQNTFALISQFRNLMPTRRLQIWNDSHVSGLSYLITTVPVCMFCISKIYRAIGLALCSNMTLVV